MKINTKYNINDRIYITPLKSWGKIMSIFIGGSLRTEYSTRYYDGLSIKLEYFLEDELTLQEEDKELGFKTK